MGAVVDSFACPAGACMAFRACMLATSSLGAHSFSTGRLTIPHGPGVVGQAVSLPQVWPQNHALFCLSTVLFSAR